MASPLVCKHILITIIYAIFLTCLISFGNAKYTCGERCENVPDCDAYRRLAGFTGGKCLEPSYEFCCCIE
ncbi:hypothetical protein BT93_H0214 [Corymbia citriodora subsp. variegata]|nr:hypothetical protein BT93_H0214 [Corymbia citriodora subsp. variegata]